MQNLYTITIAPTFAQIQKTLEVMLSVHVLTTRPVINTKI